MFDLLPYPNPCCPPSQAPDCFGSKGPSDLFAFFRLVFDCEHIQWLTLVSTNNVCSFLFCVFNFGMLRPALLHGAREPGSSQQTRVYSYSPLHSVFLKLFLSIIHFTIFFAASFLICSLLLSVGLTRPLTTLFSLSIDNNSLSYWDQRQPLLLTGQLSMSISLYMSCPCLLRHQCGVADLAHSLLWCFPGSRLRCLCQNLSC